MKNFPNRKIGSKYRWLLALAASPLLLGANCAANHNPTYIFEVKLTWQSPADMDLHMWSIPTDHCWVDSCSTPNVAGPTDDETGATGETIGVGSDSQQGRYRIGVNLHDFPVGATPGDRTVNIQLTYYDGNSMQVQNYGPYILNTPIGHGGYPVTGTTSSWIRPFDVLVLPGNIVQPTAADATPCHGP